MSAPAFDDVASDALVPLPGLLPSREQATIEALIDPFCAWFFAIRGKSQNTVAAYRQDLRAFAQFCALYGITRPDGVTYQAVEAYMAWLTMKRGRKASTANRHRYALGSFFKFLRREGLVTHDPVADTFALKEPKRIPQFLTIPEQERVLAHLARDTSLRGRRDYALVATALLTGLRVSEIATVEARNVDLDVGMLRVVGKGDKERQAIIVPRLAGILHDYLANVRPRLYGASGPYLFPRVTGRGRPTKDRCAPLDPKAVFKAIRQHVSPIVGRPVHPHMLRHSFATRLYENGADVLLLQKALGHSQLSTTAIYTHITTQKQREGVARYLK